MTQPDTPTPSGQPVRSMTFVTDMERATHLIPGFLKKTLSADDKQWMTQFLNTLNQQGGATAVEFAQEMAWVERSQQQLAEDAPRFDAQAGWQRMQGRLDAPAAFDTLVPKATVAPKVPPKPAQLAAAFLWVKAQVRSRINSAADWWRKPVVGVIASAMIVGQMGLLAAVVKQMSQAPIVAESVLPASGAPSLDGMQVLTVVFKDNASLLDVRTLIDGVQGRVIDGPGALGVWLVAVPKDKLEATLNRLGAANAVESVAPP